MHKLLYIFLYMCVHAYECLNYKIYVMNLGPNSATLSMLSHSHLIVKFYIVSGMLYVLM